MQRRGEGFERERITPEPQEVRREEPYAAEPYRTDLAPRHDLTHWSSVIVGFFASLAVIVLVGALGVALNMNTSVNVGIWAAVTLIVGFFCGGWFAARTSSVAGPTVGLIQGAAVWAVTVCILLVLSAFGAAGALGAFGLAPDMMPAAPGATPGGLTTGQLAGWAGFIALVLGLIASCAGGWLGGLAGREYTHTPLIRR